MIMSMFFPDGNISTCVGFSSRHFGAVVHGSQKINASDVCEPDHSSADTRLPLLGHQDSG